MRNPDELRVAKPRVLAAQQTSVDDIDVGTGYAAAHERRRTGPALIESNDDETILLGTTLDEDEG